MNKHMIIGGALSGLVFAGGVAGMVSAQSAAIATGLTEEQVIAIALQEIPGEVQEVELETHRGTQVYEIEILTADGAEMEVEIAAETGDVLKVALEGEGCDDGDSHDDDDDADEA
ncbi:PepSY domain-containing protein [Aestuariibius sp. HNIBRBA575]|uniref:PepSY domain-containing protein n=1 Tax=Aestuariibius sp. HNIBRBA575 TaxID=3233343 RepID=UPI0034A3E213